MTDLGYLAELPPELKYKALERLDTKSLLNACTAGKTLRFICEDDVFWRKKTMKDFFLNEEIIKYMPDNIAWFKIYEYLFTGKSTSKVLLDVVFLSRLSSIFNNLRASTPRHKLASSIINDIYNIENMDEKLLISILEAAIDYAISNSLLALSDWFAIANHISIKSRDSNNPAFGDLLVKIFREFLTGYRISLITKPVKAILTYMPAEKFKKVFGFSWNLIKETKHPKRKEEILSGIICGILGIVSDEGITEGERISKLDYAMSITENIMVNVLECSNDPQVFDDFYNKYKARIRVTNSFD